MLDKVRLRLRSLFRRPDVEFELETELRFHLDQLIEENISSGMPPETAAGRAARDRRHHAMQGGVRDVRRVNLSKILYKMYVTRFDL